ncbi:hypothetical protein EZ428_20835 [Pedobacter frigiditerrae]|uniref:Uncharacterized protein n=1 Tax=Pedobacter frigiditerrae TaxID=2530452 RepID=A0A4R0MN50_9SPHI|nr:hypothetical protein [Pedobacter frigiditerrae]TCC88170.1 hypothetical protein EZ428_20835 [Pedobacter frigiditerrae]
MEFHMVRHHYFTKMMMMMKYFPILTLLFLSIGCSLKKPDNDQVSTIDSTKNAYIQLTTEFINAVVKKEKFLLADEPFNFNAFDCLVELKNDTLTFTKSEINYILKEQSLKPIKKWTKDLLPNSKIIAQDSINNIFKDRTKGWNYFYKNIGQSFETFSNPIFVRNNTYCIFYKSNSCGWLCAGGNLSVYKKEGNNWIVIKSYCNWVS